MPKERKHISAAQAQRNKIKEKSARYVPGKVTLQVLGTGAEGAPRSLYVFSDQSRYLFNCGEGTQRLAHEHKMKLSKLEHIFITQPAWRNIGGLPGAALTIQDVGVPEITLHGPKGLEEIFTATRKFVIIRDLTIRIASCDPKHMFEDNVIKVQYVPLARDHLSQYNPLRTSQEDEELLPQGSNDKCMQAGSINGSVDASTSTKFKRKKSMSSASSSRSSSPTIIEDTTDYYAHESKGLRMKSRNAYRTHNPDSGKRIAPQSITVLSQSLLEETMKKAISMAYICRLQPRPGALSLEKCVKMGVPPGPMLGKLKNGEDVTLPNGNVVKSKDVCEPDDPGPIFIVIECPTEEYLDSLVNNPAFRKHQSHATRDEDLCTLVVHFSPPHIMDNPRYRLWMDEFSPSTQHIVLNESNTCMGSQSVHRIQHKLNLLSEDMFPLLGDNGTKICDEEASGHVLKKIKSDNGPVASLEKLSVQSPQPFSAPYLIANTFLNYHLRPKKGIDRSSELSLTPSQYLDETLSEEGFSSALQELKRNLREKQGQLFIRPYPKLLFLGTGSCIPNKTRNTSGMLLTTGNDKHILIDCGEGTYGQIVRFFGKEKCDSVIANINAIYISHLHADHHIGLIGVLQARRRAIKKLKLKRDPLYLFAPLQILWWLNFYNKCFETISSEYTLIPNADLLYEKHSLQKPGESEVFQALDMTDISTCYVKHCPNAFGVCFQHGDGYKITYSGDTMPTESLVELGKDSDILIHEATMEDELCEEAILKMHSTTSQAIDVGIEMNAKHILLTHFSQRYAKMPRFNERLKENVIIAFDNMQVKLDELPLVPLLYPALKIMFAEHCEELESKAVKRQLRIEKEREASLDRQSKEKLKA